MFHIFHILQSDMYFGVTNPFSLPDRNAFLLICIWRQDNTVFPAFWILIGQFKFQARLPYVTAWFSILIGYANHNFVFVCLLGVITSFVVDPCHSWLTVGTSAGMLVCWDLRFQLPITNLSHPRGNVSVLWLTVKCWWCWRTDFVYWTVMFKRFQALVFVGSPLTRSSSPGSCLLCRATMKWPCGIWRLERGDRLCGQAIPHPCHKHRFDTKSSSFSTT